MGGHWGIWGALGGPPFLAPPLQWQRCCLQSAVQSGRLQVPPGYHPLDVEKEWGELHAALLQREKLLRQECDRWGGALRGGGSVAWGRLHVALLQ